MPANKKIKGGPITIPNKATTQDSLDIFNSTQALNQYYNDQKHGYKLNRISPSQDLDDYLSGNGKYSKKSSFTNDYIQKNISDILKWPKPFITSYPEWAKSNNIRSSRDVQNLADNAKKNYAKVMNHPYQGIIYDQVVGAMDFAPPPAKFDTRIKTQGTSHYRPNQWQGPGNNVELPYYDPISVKPVHMLTPKERIEREKKYGAINKTKPVPKVSPKVALKVKPKTDAIELLTTKTPSLQVLNNFSQRPELKTVSIQKNIKKPSPALQYPAQNQNLLQKIKSKITGKSPMPYWEDKQGVKHYPSKEENNPDAVKEIQMMKSGLDPKNPEDAIQLNRIDAALSGSKKELGSKFIKYQLGVKSAKFKN